MEPAAKGRTEKSFSYVVRAPGGGGGDGFDVVNVDVKMDTAWIFQDAEDDGEEPGRLPEEAARSPGVDARTRGKQLESSEQTLLAAVDKYVMSESGPRSRIQELELSERKLLQKVDQLSTRVFQERSASLWAQEKLEALQVELASQDGPGHAQDELQPLPREQALEACGSQGSDRAPGPSGSAGQPSEGSCTCVLMSGPGTPADTLPGDLAGSDHAQVTPEPSLGEEILPIWDCPLGQCVDGALLPVELAWISEQKPAATPARESFVLVQTSIPPPWGRPGDPALLPLPLLPLEASPEDLQAQQMLKVTPPPAPSATAPAGRGHRARSPDARLCQESPHAAGHRVPRMGPEDLKELWKEGGAPAWRLEMRAKRTWGRKEGALGDRGQPSQESDGSLSLSLEAGVRATEGTLSETGASRPQAAAPCPWSKRELPLPLLQGEASVPTEGPESSGRKGRGGGGGGGGGGRGGGLSPPSSEAVPAATFSRAQSASGPPLMGTQQGRASRRVQGQEEICVWSGNAQFLPEESPGEQGQEEEEEPVMHLEGSSPAPSHVHREPGSEDSRGKETLFFLEEGGPPPSPGLALSPQGTEPTSQPWPPSKGHEGSALTIEEFEKEMEACFQQLSILKLGSGGRGWAASLLAGEAWSFAPRWHSGREDEHPQQALANQGLHCCFPEEAKPEMRGDDAKPGGTEALGTESLPRLGLDGVGLSPSPPEGSSRRGWNGLAQHPSALRRARGRLRRLMSGLKKERSQVFQDNAKLRAERERCCRRLRALEKERERHESKIATLDQQNGALLGAISDLKGERDRYAQVIADLEDCNGKSYRRMSELEEENDRLRGDLGRLGKAGSASIRKSRGATEPVTPENGELGALISELGIRYKELIKDAARGIEDMIQTFRGESEALLRRIRVLEREVAAGSSPEGVRLLRAGGHSQEKSTMAVDRVNTVERGVQVTQLSGQLTASVPGPPSEQEMLLAGEWTEPHLSLQNSRQAADATAPSLVWGNAARSSALQGSSDRAGVKEAPKRPLCLADQGQAPRSPHSGSQHRDPEAEASEEDLGLRVRQLCHQVRTLQCQLRDQSSAHRALQASFEEATRLQGELQGKAKLASLVQKCQERNHLITRLLEELHRHGAGNRLLSEVAHSMVTDVALAEYVATFLAPGDPETSRHLDLDVESEQTADEKAQKYLLNPELDSVLQRPLHSESWPIPEAEWPQTAQLDSLKLPWPSGPMPDPGMGQASVAVEPGLPVQWLQEQGGRSRPVLQAAPLPPCPVLRSPARILALHQELRQSVCSSAQVHQSLLEL
ncbi:uncharacterized protein C4orf50 homolog [Phacochoerus africanus]|uniref:uncharacterized protein C4orf50 homolog n=1 Tax=Phacochoerus africanus TaxID=41426 RepID=UPI001FDA0EC8|nr:uncharacterized protein C4orf50 homolog [Phacochoerus africanus]